MIRSIRRALLSDLDYLVTCWLQAMEYTYYNRWPMRFMTAREAKRAFSQILKEAEDGASIVITRRGRPIALLAPYPAPDARERELAVERIVALMREGLPSEGRRFTRNEMHGRREPL